MFPDIVTVSELKRDGLDTGNGYTVGKLKSEATKKAAYMLRTDMLVGKFEGLNALFDYQAKKQKSAQHSGSSDDRGRNGSFHYFGSFNEAIKTFKEEPGKIIEFAQLDDMIDGGDASGLELEYDVTGDMLDVGRFLSGEPEVFASLTNGKPRNKRVNIQVNLSWWVGVSNQTINLRARRLIRLVDWLEAQQVRTQVVGIDSGECYHIEIVIKRFEEPLVLSDIAIVGHSDFLRRILFRFSEYSDTHHGGYGNCAVLNDYFRRRGADSFISDYNDEHTVIIGGNKPSEMAIEDSFNRLEKGLQAALADDEPAATFMILL